MGNRLGILIYRKIGSFVTKIVSILKGDRQFSYDESHESMCL